MNKALILGPGGARASYLMGFLWVAQQSGKSWDQIYGISAGAIAGAFYTTGKISDAVGILKEIDTSDIHAKHGVLWTSLRYVLHSFLKTPKPQYIHNNEALRHLLKSQLGNENIKKKTELYAGRVCLDDDTYHDTTSDRPEEFWKEVLASASIPGYWPPVEIEGKKYVDGGIDHAATILHAAQRGAKQIDVILTDGYDDLGPSNPTHLIDYVSRSLAIMFRNVIQRDIELTRSVSCVDINIITPPKHLGSALDFSNKNSRELLKIGEETGLNTFDLDRDTYRPIFS